MVVVIIRSTHASIGGLKEKKIDEWEEKKTDKCAYENVLTKWSLSPPPSSHWFYGSERRTNFAQRSENVLFFFEGGGRGRYSNATLEVLRAKETGRLFTGVVEHPPRLWKAEMREMDCG